MLGKDYKQKVGKLFQDKQTNKKRKMNKNRVYKFIGCTKWGVIGWAMQRDGKKNHINHTNS